MWSDVEYDTKTSVINYYLKKYFQIGKVGITSYASDQLGDIVHIEFPEVNKKLS